MAEPEWVELETIEVLHDASLAAHGGASGIRDKGLLESALQRPPYLFFYEGQTDICILAAPYAAAVSGNHPFADGNKRAAFHAMVLFMRLNGLRLVADQGEAAAAIYSLAAGELDSDRLAEWLRRNVQAS
jgi:death-on-curing protein